MPQLFTRSAQQPRVALYNNKQSKQEVKNIDTSLEALTSDILYCTTNWSPLAIDFRLVSTETSVSCFTLSRSDTTLTVAMFLIVTYSSCSWRLRNVMLPMWRTADRTEKILLSYKNKTNRSTDITTELWKQGMWKHLRFSKNISLILVSKVICSEKLFQLAQWKSQRHDCHS